jgi:hypothetical protein
MRLRRLCLAIFALRFFLMDPIGLYSCGARGGEVLVDDFVEGVFDDAFGTK